MVNLVLADEWLPPPYSPICQKDPRSPSTATNTHTQTHRPSEAANTQLELRRGMRGG